MGDPVADWPDWAQGLPSDVLALVAKAGGDGVKAMRGVNRHWQCGFELGVRCIRVPWKSPSLYMGTDMALRFPSLTSLDLGESSLKLNWLRKLQYLPKLRVLVLGCTSVPGNSHLAARLTNAGMRHLRGLPITHLGLSWCCKVTDLGLLCLLGMPRSILSLDLENCKMLEPPEGLKALLWMRLRSLNLVR